MRLMFLWVIFAIKVASAASESQPSPTSARFVYLEFYPNSDKELIIQAFKCDTKMKELRLQSFLSETKVTNEVVNVLNLYIRAGDCRESAFSSVWQEKVVLPKNGRSTHVYLTLLSNNVSVL